jgi:4a-hydroxytetrahydrobiopterin dehydratase
MKDLADRKCEPCSKGSKPLRGEAAAALAAHVPEWVVVDEHHLERRFEKPDFRSALKLVNGIGEIAEAAGHHPDIRLSWGRVVVLIWTHSIDGLSEADFVLASKIDRLVATEKTRSES